MDIKEEALKKHYEWQGKIEVVSRTEVKDAHDLSRRSNLIAVITDGSAVLGLGNIGPEAGMPVMEGKCVLFKEFAGVDAFPICVRSNDVDEIVDTVYRISGSFGGINLEDIAAPRCFEIERKLKERCDIPVFHDDQHGTAICVAAAVMNALKITGKTLSGIKCVINGAVEVATRLSSDSALTGRNNTFTPSSFPVLARFTSASQSLLLPRLTSAFFSRTQSSLAEHKSAVFSTMSPKSSSNTMPDF